MITFIYFQQMYFMITKISFMIHDSKRSSELLNNLNPTLKSKLTLVRHAN